MAKKATRKPKPGRPMLLTRDEMRVSVRPGRYVLWPTEGRLTLGAGGWWKHQNDLPDLRGERWTMDHRSFHRKYPKCKLPPGGGPLKVRVSIEVDE